MIWLARRHVVLQESVTKSKQLLNSSRRVGQRRRRCRQQACNTHLSASGKSNRFLFSMVSPQRKAGFFGVLVGNDGTFVLVIVVTER
jgi:hypothetical protein